MNADDTSIPPSLPPQSLPPQGSPSPYAIGMQGSQLTPASLVTMSLSPPGAEPPPVRRRRGWLTFLVVGVLAIALGVGTGLFLHRAGGSGGTGPSDTVLRFYQAVRDARAQAALNELATPPADTSFITDTVLRAAQQTAPITELAVPATGSTVVTVSYRLGGDQVTDRVSVTAVGNGYKIITAPNGGGVSLTSLQRQGVTLSIAGQPVTRQSVILLPGAYPIRSSSAFLAYGQGSLVVKRIDDAGNVAELSPKVTPDGMAAVRQAVRDSLTACTKAKSFAPPACPFKYTGPSAATADPAKATWDLVGDPTSDLRVTLGNNPTKVDLQTNLVARLVVSPGAQPLDIPTNGARGTVDLTQPKPVVTWTA